MTLADELFDIEHEAYRKSPVHILDARIKLILCLAGLLVTVFLPFNVSADGIIPWTQIFGLAALYLLFWVLYFLSGASIRYYLIRLLILIPFGIFIIILQPFFFNPYYDAYHVIVSLPFGINIYWESLVFGISLFLKFIISLSFIILLSATTTMQSLVQGAARMHVPRIFITVLTLTVRYLFVFAQIFKKIQLAFSCRCFQGTGRGMKLKYRLNVIGNAAGSLFVRALEQGERTYLSMCCRGYNDESSVFVRKKPITSYEWIFLTVGIMYIILAPIFVYMMF